MATMRLDGFAAMTAGGIQGSILTKPLRFDRGRLYVNADVEPGGRIQAEVLDESNAVRPGYRLSDCAAATGNSVRAPLS